MLNELDKELERRGLRYVRFADDILNFVKSRKSAERVSEGITKFIEERLKLKVNRDKTKITKPTEVKYLGFSFYIVKGKVRLRPHPKSIKKMKEKVRELTKRSSGRGYECQKAVLREFIERWVEYFKIADMKSQLKKTDQ